MSIKGIKIHLLHCSEYIHYVLSHDCRLTVTRSWKGSTLREFDVTSKQLDICKPDNAGNPMHYVEAEPGKIPLLVFIIYLRKEDDLYAWRIVRINITMITYRPSFRRTIMDSLLAEPSTLYTAYPIRTCTYHSQNSIYCFWQNGTEQWAQKYSVVNKTLLNQDYRADDEPFHLDGHANFGDVVGSLPGNVPRLLMFDYRTRNWFYVMKIRPNMTMAGRRIQEMRHVGKVKGKLGQVAAMDSQSFIITDCNNNECAYRYNSLELIAKATTACVYTSPAEAISGVFKTSRNLLKPLVPEVEDFPAPEVSKVQQMPETRSFFRDYTMIIVYAFTVAVALSVKLLMEIYILALSPSELHGFEEAATAFYTCLFPGLTRVTDI